MKTLSLCMIVKNEQDVLGRCLDSVKQCVDEIVIVDTGSNDNTAEIAKHYTDKIFKFKWIDDFAAARNYAFSKATTDYVMWLDADDVVPSATVEQINLLKAIDFEGRTQFAMRYCVAFDEENIPTFWYDRERIALRGSVHWCGYVHESFAWSKDIRKLSCEIHHKKQSSSGTRNLEILRKKKVMQGGDVRLQYYYCRELYENGYFALCEKNLYGLFRRNVLQGVNAVGACVMMSELNLRKGDHSKALLWLLRVELYEQFNPEICCKIGKLLFDEHKYEHAIVWYDRALSAKFAEYDFVQEDCNSFLPHIMLCVCYDRLSNHKQARKHHEICKRIKPNHPSVVQNEKYFASIHSASI